MFFLLLGCLVSLSRAQDGVECWQDPCKTYELHNEEKFLETFELEDTAFEPKNCQDKCKEYGEGNQCKYFSYEFSGVDGDPLDVQCHLFKEKCDTTPATESRRSVSGPKDCPKDADLCDLITLPAQPDSETLIWIEEKGGDPYKEKFPEGSTITTSCGSENYEATCTKEGEEMKWVPNKNDGPDPTTPEKDKSKCKCPEFEFGYDPNKEPGAQFFCDPEFKFEDGKNTKLEATSECILICDHQVRKQIFCHDGGWNDVDDHDIADGFGCYHRPTTTTAP